MESKKNKKFLHILLGTDPFEKYLSEIPHILIVGDSENGRKEYVDRLLEQLIKNYSSKDLHLALIDTNNHDFSKFKNDQHLFSRIDTGIKTLESLVDEMNKRYTLFWNNGFTNIASFNSAESNKEKLPFLIVVVEAKEDFYKNEKMYYCIMNLAQKGRAAGIHVILSVPYLKKTLSRAKIFSLKVNLPMHILFKTSNNEESESIINGLNNEQLELKNKFALEWNGHINVLTF